MAAAKMRRWVCPTCGDGCLAPSRPRRDDVRRYCLDCSKRSGRLVERSCPANERKREASSARSTSRRKAAADRQKAAEDARYVVNCVDAVETIHRLDVREEVWRQWRILAPRWRAQPTLDVIRTTKGIRGRAWWGGRHRVLLRVHDGCSMEGLKELIMHELVHLFASPHDKPVTNRNGHERQQIHGPAFRRALVESAQTLWPDVRVGSLNRGAYVLDGIIRAELDRLTREGVAV